ncbi:hypothetical protein GWK47_030741 [Chionoecetes opilio]|uniref:MADF domain-containing protein n=1 Tax=Chionoecetes opilio TaxID=41210 RepID=A0A8J4YLC4_CHIOP|nr:hypothetical protein GWK47_030741 [Chionoecetes opilio]
MTTKSRSIIQEVSFALLEKVRHSEELWIVRHAGYIKKPVKRALWEKITKELKAEYPSLAELTTVAVLNQFNVLEDPVELWDTFKHQTLQAAKECIGERPRSMRGFVSTGTLENIKESRAARLAGNQDQHGALSHRTSSGL